YPHEVPRALAEFLRILRLDGDLLIQVPDLAQAAAAVADGRGDRPLYQSPGGPITAMDMLFGYSRCVEASPAMTHHTGFWADRLQRTVERAGFAGVNVWVDQFDLFCVAQKPMTPTQPLVETKRPHRAAAIKETP